jgi:hypothetical protein
MVRIIITVMTGRFMLKWVIFIFLSDCGLRARALHAREKKRFIRMQLICDFDFASVFQSVQAESDDFLSGLGAAGYFDIIFRGDSCFYGNHYRPAVLARLEYEIIAVFG